MKKQKKDMFLIGGLLAVAVIAAVCLQLFTGQGSQVIAYVDGEEVGRWSLEETVDVVLQTATGQNRLMIEDGRAYVTEADCPDGICVKQGKISRTGQTIVCLPHKLVIEIEGEAEENGIDAVAN